MKLKVTEEKKPASICIQSILSTKIKAPSFIFEYDLPRTGNTITAQVQETCSTLIWHLTFKEQVE